MELVGGFQQRSVLDDVEESVREHLLGELELVVLGAVVGVREETYGLEIRRLIDEQTGRSVAIGSVYRCLSALERKGLVASRTGDPLPVRGGRARRYFTSTAEGVAALRRAVGDVQRLAGPIRLGLEGS